MTVPDLDSGEIIDHGEKLGVIRRTAHLLGDVISMSEHDAVLMTYFRNNIQHLFAVPASIACCFIQGRRLEHGELQRLIRMIYPFMRVELQLKWNDDEIDDITTKAIEALLDQGVLARKARGVMPEKCTETGDNLPPAFARFLRQVVVSEFYSHLAGT